IRDGHVTGVQTCALPISSHGAEPPVATRPTTVGLNGFEMSTVVIAALSATYAYRPWTESPRAPLKVSWIQRTDYQDWRHHTLPRSEERRVGKECKRRWSR